MNENADSSPETAAYLEQLNPPQRQAVLHGEGPLLVLAGAGTGKTRVLTTRLAHLMRNDRARPWEILAVTFTNKAAREMRDRVSALAGPAAGDVWLGTFHAIAARLLRRHAEPVGLQPNFSILDTDDQLRLLKQVLETEKIDTKRWPARKILGPIQRWKDQGLEPEHVSANHETDVADGQLLPVYRRYQAELRRLNSVDFGDLLLLILGLFMKQADIAARYQEKFRYLLVDEYQDTNTAQHLWLRLLAQRHRNICCVGDDDQSIYGWRGADVGNILRFETDYPGAAIIRLEQNYRSTPQILTAASTLIAQNAGRFGKTLWTEGGNGPPVRVSGYWDGDHEAVAVADALARRIQNGTPAGQIAILVRAGFQTRAFEERFLVLGLAYQVIGGFKFYDRQEIRDATAYMRVLAQPDDDLAFERIVNTPRRGLGKTTMQALHEAARVGRTSLTRAAKALLEADALRPAARRALGGLLDDFDRWRRLPDGLSLTDALTILLEESGYLDLWRKDKSPEAEGRLDNLKELVTAVGEFDSLQAFLEHISLVTDMDQADETDRVTLMTLHAAKGLEFNHVFLPGWEEGLFPHQRAIDGDELGEDGAPGNGPRESRLEEERRLAYVGLTRARREVHISYVQQRRVYDRWIDSEPSRFIEELPGTVIELNRASGMRALRRRPSAPPAPAAPTAPKAPKAPAPVAAAAQRAPATQGGATQRAAAAMAAMPEIPSVGAQVIHRKFGRGTVLAVQGDKLEIEFETSGRKKVVAGFVQTTR